MIKKIFTLSVIALGMIACNGTEPAADETQTESMQEEIQDHDSHEGHDHSGAVGEDATTFTAPEGASVHFANLKDGDTVTSPVLVEFGVTGMIKAAGEITQGTGHHHIIIDGEATPQGTAVPADDTHIHFGGGQTETELTLTPGAHTLTMQFANGMHESYGEQMSATITVYVK